jgi:hypothetical protein
VIEKRYSVCTVLELVSTEAGGCALSSKADPDISQTECANAKGYVAPIVLVIRSAL